MVILAVESTEITASAALADGDRFLAQTNFHTGLTHSETLLPAVEGLLAGAGLTFRDIDLFACSAGPGSFTGVRIGAATVKGLAFGREKPCVGVSALASLAYNFLGLEGLVCPVMDARRQVLYNALFRLTKDGEGRGRIERLTEDRVIPAKDLLGELSTFSEPIFLCGEGEGILRKAWEEAAGQAGKPTEKAGAGASFPRFADTPPLLRHQNAFSVALCAYDLYKNSDDPSRFTDRALFPTYLRPSSAERMKTGG